MKRFISLLFILSIAGFFSQCTKDDVLKDFADQNDQETSSLKSMKFNETSFTGTSVFVAPIEAGTEINLPNGKTLIAGQTAEWYDEASDSRVTGKSVWYVNWLKEPDPNTAKVWGKAELFVGVKATGDTPQGKWEITWEGNQTPDGGGFLIDVTATGIGTEGVVKGLTATWKYTMDISKGFIYESEGVIKKSGKPCFNNGKIKFAGGSWFMSPGEPGEEKELPNGKTLVMGQTAEWYDVADDWRVSGKSTWSVNWLKDSEPNTAKLWGKGEIVLFNGKGKWDITWSGEQTPTANGFKLTDTATGIGVEGEVKGMIARWHYEMNFDVNDPANTFFYELKGVIFENGRPGFNHGKRPFVVVSTPAPDPGDSEGTSKLLPNGKTLITGMKHTWYDDASDPRVKGKSVWYINWLTEPDGITAKLWGKADIIADNNLGKWRLSWHGNITPAEPPLVFILKVTAVGHGIEGSVKGLVAKWSYTMNFDGNNSSFFYTGDGVIFDKPPMHGGHGHMHH